MDNTELYIYAFHALIIMPFLLYISIYKCKIPNYVYGILAGISVIGLLYHGFKMIDIYYK
jgi:hypothetical protein